MKCMHDGDLLLLNRSVCALKVFHARMKRVPFDGYSTVILQKRLCLKALDDADAPFLNSELLFQFSEYHFAPSADLWTSLMQGCAQNSDAGCFEAEKPFKARVFRSRGAEEVRGARESKNRGQPPHFLSKVQSQSTQTQTDQAIVLGDSGIRMRKNASIL